MNFAGLLIDLIDLLVRVFEFILLARIIMTWFYRSRGNNGVGGQVFSVVYMITEPVLSPIRNLILKSPMRNACQNFDFSPIFAFAEIRAASALLIRLIIIIAVNV